MIYNCEKCNKDFLTEADPYGVIPSHEGNKLVCGNCFTGKLTTTTEAKLKIAMEALNKCLDRAHNEYIIRRTAEEALKQINYVDKSE